MGKNEKILAVIFPGIGYHADKPLLYYANRYMSSRGAKIVNIVYSDMPQKIKGDKEMMKKAAGLAYEQACAQLSDTEFDKFDKIIFIGKSIGTTALARYAAEHGTDAMQIWLTPVEATFLYAKEGVLAFIGDADPWSDVPSIVRMAEEKGVRLYEYGGCNHSLECGDIDRDIATVGDVMMHIARFLDGRGD